MNSNFGVISAGSGKTNNPPTPLYNANIFNGNVNVPKLLTGMEPIKFTLPTNSTKGSFETTTADDENWYSYGTTYETRKWANAKTADGSMWVWIPRYAYKITGTTIDVKFLVEDTGNYYENGELKSATANGYKIHPAFENGSTTGKNNNFANGEWDKELTGIWVAKFEAGYAGSYNGTTAVDSTVAYTKNTANFNGTPTVNSTKIKYPIFKPLTYSMNYISINDIYSLSKSLTTPGNIYGLSSSTTDSHMMKNSEWGAVAYLAQSIYGQNGTEITINNANINNVVNTIYAITGCTSNTTNNNATTVTYSDLSALTGNTATNGIYTWDQVSGQNASTTGNMYGIYDLSGGTWEYNAGFVSNGHSNLATYGKAILDEAGVTYSGKTVIAKTGASTKYVTRYPYNSSSDSNTNNWTAYNTAKTATYGYGDAILETSTSGSGSNSWNGDYSNFPYTSFPFFLRGGDCGSTSTAGVFAFDYYSGDANFITTGGFRVVLVEDV